MDMVFRQEKVNRRAYSKQIMQNLLAHVPALDYSDFNMNVCDQQIGTKIVKRFPTTFSIHYSRKITNTL
eukprot:snap_masked-scaffold_5-processed-gene-1.41-mRNA-1 protein AED:1.00 eAED:1.00 QI:0/0/0/0/1/1/2/0/68